LFDFFGSLGSLALENSDKNTGDTGGATEDDLVGVGLVDLGVTEGLLDGLEGGRKKSWQSSSKRTQMRCRNRSSLVERVNFGGSISMEVWATEERVRLTRSQAERRWQQGFGRGLNGNTSVIREEMNE
jgi:hypothetical protein